MSRDEIFGRMSGGAGQFVFASACYPAQVCGMREGEAVRDAIQKKFSPEQT